MGIGRHLRGDVRDPWRVHQGRRVFLLPGGDSWQTRDGSRQGGKGRVTPGLWSCKALSVSREPWEEMGRF